MPLHILSFALGVWLCQQQVALASSLPVLSAWAGVFVPALLLKSRWPRAGKVLLLLASVLVGFSYANWRAELRLNERLAEQLEGQDIEISVRIADLPQPLERSLRFVVDTLEAPAGVPPRLSLSWYAKGNPLQAESETSALPALRAGERWRFTVRLRQPHGSVNPYGFDYEGYIFQRGIGAIGYVRPKGRNARLAAFDASPMAYVNRWREHIRERFERALPDSAWRGVLVALVVGDQASISKEQWALFRQTGVTHLMSISGLHVTLIASLFAWLLGSFWRRVPALALRLPAQKAAVLAGFVAAGMYVVLAGFGVPAQRTLYMLAVAALALWLERGASASRVLAVALLVVLLIDPWAVLSAGFWLSFGAVGALFLLGRQTGRGGVWHWVLGCLQAQWAVTLLTLPLLLGLFHQFSLISPVANALAIPVVSALITPLALLFAALPLPSLAEAANALTVWLMHFLHWCAAQPFAVWQQAAPPGWLVALCCVSALWALMPRGVPARYVGLLSFIPLVTWSPPRPAVGMAEVMILDVGQGLAVHVRTAEHDLLFDTGPQYGLESDAGERIVIPWLRASGTPRLDRLIVSHDDNDHSGGADSLLSSFPVSLWQSSLPPEHVLMHAAVPHQPCLRGERWLWDGVTFEFLHPFPGFSGRDNDRSCVLKVSTAQASVLLTGDIERSAETELLAFAPATLAADILLAPHHGSRSSSHDDFVAAVGARHVVFTAGYRNRYQHPAPSVLARYAASGATSYRSDGDGAVRFDLLPTGIQPFRARTQLARYWHDASY